jgi:hypothetical protein
MNIPISSISLMIESQSEDIRLAATKMYGAKRRSFQADMALKYCQGSARRAEKMFGWGRQNVKVGMAEKRTGIICLGEHSAFSGNKCWEERYPKGAESLRQLAESHSQQDPSFRTQLAYTRLTAREALKQLGEQGISKEELPAPSTMAKILNRMGFRLRKVVKAKPQKKFQKQTPFLTI